METNPHAILHLEFAADGSVEYSWPRGDMHFLRTAFRNLAAAVLTDTRELDWVTGATGIPWGPAGLWTTPNDSHKSCADGRERQNDGLRTRRDAS